MLDKWEKMCICLICLFGYIGIGVWGKMITKPVNDGLHSPYIFSTSISLTITIINSKMFVDKPVDKPIQNSHIWGVEGL
jgi:hypothetical protein